MDTGTNRIGWLSLRDCASYFGVTYETIRKWVAVEKLRTIRIGNLYKVVPEELERFAREGNYRRNIPNTFK